MMQAHGIKGLLNVGEGMDIEDLPTMLTTLGSVTRLASSLPGKAAKEKRFLGK